MIAGEASLERQLEVAGALTDALLHRCKGDLDGSDPASREAIALFEDSALPSAVFDAPVLVPRRANAMWRAVFGPRELPAVFCEAIAAGANTRSGRLATHIEFAVELDSGLTSCAASVRPRHDGLGVVTGALVVCAVVTNGQYADLLKDQFIAAVSHELRAPVATMLLWDKVLREGSPDAALRILALDAIHQSALSQSRIVGDLLDYARGRAGKLYVDVRSIELGATVRESIAEAAPSAAAKQVVIHQRIEDVDEVLGDCIRLRQVVDNLLSNAIKFSDPGGHVNVTVTRRQRTIAIEIEDHGRGIGADFLEHVFAPFSQMEDPLTRGAGGLGLGLAIAKQLVELHGGTLSGASSGLARGSTFTVTLPVADSQAPAPIALSRRKIAGARLLVVDDDQRVREGLAILLDRAGAVVETAASAETARPQIARHAPDAIVCDIAMPGEDGYAFMRSLRSAGCTTPAIALTAHALPSDVHRARAAGFDLHLAKPIDFDRLVTSIAELLAG